MKKKIICPERGWKKEARKNENAMGGVTPEYGKRYLESVGEKWKTTAKDRSWRLLIENGVRESEERNHEEKDVSNHGQSYP